MMFRGLKIGLGLWILLAQGFAQAQPLGPADVLLAEGDFGTPSVLRHGASAIDLWDPLLVYSSTFVSAGERVASYVGLPYEGLDADRTDELLDLLGSVAGGMSPAEDGGPSFGDRSRWFSSFSMESGPGHTVAFRIGQWFGAVEVRGGPSGPDRVRQAARLAAILAARLQSLAPTPGGESASAFVGDWGRHGFGIRIEPDRSASASWRTYRWCFEGWPPPCDSIAEDGLITSGGAARLEFSDMRAATLQGKVVATTEAEMLGISEARATLVPYQMLVLQTGSDRRLLLCSAASFGRLPPRFRESAPCGA